MCHCKILGQSRWNLEKDVFESCEEGSYSLLVGKAQRRSHDDMKQFATIASRDGGT